MSPDSSILRTKARCQRHGERSCSVCTRNAPDLFSLCHLALNLSVKSFLTESGKRKPLGYLTFHESRSAFAMVLDHGIRPGTRPSWVAKVPDGGEWNKSVRASCWGSARTLRLTTALCRWIPPTQAEIRRAKELAAAQSREAAALSLGTGSAHDLGLDPREVRASSIQSSRSSRRKCSLEWPTSPLQIFFVDGHLTVKEKEAKLEKVFGPASRSFPSFPLYIVRQLPAWSRGRQSRR